MGDFAGRVFGDGDDADAATRPCFQARLAVESPCLDKRKARKWFERDLRRVSRDGPRGRGGISDLAESKTVGDESSRESGVGKWHFHQCWQGSVQVNDEKKKEKATT